MDGQEDKIGGPRITSIWWKEKCELVKYSKDHKWKLLMNYTTKIKEMRRIRSKTNK